MQKSLFLLTFALLTGWWRPATAQNDRLTPEKLWQFGRVSVEDLSPDGKTVLYGVTYYDLAENKGNRDLYLVSLAGGDARKITAFEGSEVNGRFRADGKKIGFLRGGDLWEMNADGTDQHLAGPKGLGATGFEYSPTGDKIMFTKMISMGGNPNQKLYEGLPKANAYIADDLMYRHWTEWEDFMFSNVHYIAYDPAKGLVGEPVNIQGEGKGEPYDSPMNPFGGIEEIAWSSDGKYIAYTCKKMSGKAYAESTNSEIYLFELATGKTINVSAPNPGYDKEPSFSPDGKYLMWTSMATPGFESDRTRIILHELATGKKTELTEGYDEEANSPRWAADSKTVYFISGVKATFQLFSVEVATRKIRQITTGQHDFTSLFPTADGLHLVGDRVSMSEPQEVYKVGLAKGDMTPLTTTNKALLSGLKFGKVEEKWVKTTDGKQMLVWMIYPPDFNEDEKYPTLLYCQGGPQSAVSQTFSYRWNFQLMAANGYIVVAPNRRGLPSFGTAWNNEVSGDWGGQAMRDYLSATDYARSLPNVNADKMGAVGASFGGFSVYWLAGNHEKRFKAFIAHCGLYNMDSWYATTEELFFANHDLKGKPWEANRSAAYTQFSPHLYARKWDTPILVIHNEKDFRVPLQEGMQAFNAARMMDIPSRFLCFPDEGHWVTQPQNAVLWHRVFFNWLDTYLK